MKKFILGFILGTFLVSSCSYATDWGITNTPQIDAGEPTFAIFQGTLSEGQSLSSRLQTIIQNTQTEGTQAYVIKELFTRVVPTGKSVAVNMQIRAVAN